MKLVTIWQDCQTAPPIGGPQGDGQDAHHERQAMDGLAGAMARSRIA
ncbi:MAG TPA: hypothetical protein VJM76_05305 [Gammaproteobacteria bacterium]|nr:hypothetical protein [Gammaproteobacteria bacterium]